MATGISKHEQHGLDAISAFCPHSDTIPLPENHEPVQLSYQGKASEAEILDAPSFRFVSVDQNRAPNQIDNINTGSFVLTDNFFGLHDLLASERKATLFYLDPPYGTGMDFQSRDMEHAYNDCMGPATYTEFLRRRMVLMRECMSDDASIYVHIGHQMLAHLKMIMDEVFGPKNFRNIIARRKCSSKNFTRKQYANLNDYILFYTKSNNYKWNQPGIKPEQQWIDREYPKVDEQGRIYKLVPVHAPGTRHGETGKPWRDKLPPAGKHWQYTPSKLDEFDAQGDIHWSRNGNPRRKVYWTPNKLVPLTDYWEKYRDAHHQSIKITGYPTEKNFNMIKMIVEASSDPGDLVVDPFCGSGTTLHAARDLGRDWMGFDASFPAAKATMRRLRHGTEAMGDYISGKKVNGHKHLDNMFMQQDAHGGEVQFVVDAWLWETYQNEITDIASI